MGSYRYVIVDNSRRSESGLYLANAVVDVLNAPSKAAALKHYADRNLDRSLAALRRDTVTGIGCAEFHRSIAALEADLRGPKLHLYAVLQDGRLLGAVRAASLVKASGGVSADIDVVPVWQLRETVAFKNLAERISELVTEENRFGDDGNIYYPEEIYAA
jgi:hypothetical protein